MIPLLTVKLLMFPYEAYWLTDFPLKIIERAQKNDYGDLSKSKQTSIYIHSFSAHYVVA